MAVFLALGFGLLISSSVWVAAAQPRSIQQQLFGTTTVVRTTVTAPPTVVTTPTSITPTSRSVPPVTRPRATLPPGPTTTTVPPATTAAPTTTVAAIPGAPPPPSTVPLALAPQSGHVSVVFPILSGIGFAALVAMLVAQYFMTGPGNRGGPTL